VSAMAAHLSHAMERPAHFFAADCAFSSGRGVGLLVDAATARARSTPCAACAGTSCRARAVSTTRDYPHKEPHWRTHLRIASRALRTDHC
jgi:2-succinyl-5-enolpyruvyl-6-hydroxy-3-cyclohexene-1-carboxylate synthase